MLTVADKKQENIINVAFSGVVTQEEYDQVNQLIKAHKDKHGQVDMLIEVNDFSWNSLKAMLEDFKLSIKYLPDFNKLAIVTDKKWLTTTTKVVDEILPFIYFKLFHFEEANTAREWLED